MAAEPIQIQGTPEQGKIRNPVNTLLLALFVPFYAVVWYYKVNKELAAIGRANNTDECGTSPGTSVLAVTLGGMVIVPAVISLYNTWKRLHAAGRLTGAQPSMEAAIGTLLMFVVAGYYFFQESLNAVLQRQAQGQPALGQQQAPAAPKAQASA